MKSGKRCKGHCCKLFFLNYSPEELWTAYGEWVALQEDKRPGGRIINREIYLVAPMVRLEEVFKPGETDPMGVVCKKTSYFYSCAHQNDNGDCGIYQHRPVMCVNYPYGKRCVYDGCTYEEAEEDVIKLLEDDKPLK